MIRAYWRAIAFASVYSARERSRIDHGAQGAIRAIVCCAMLIAFCTAGHSQIATGQFDGHVFDQAGAVVVGASVNLVDTQSGFSRAVHTNGEGLYRLPLLSPGIYKITVSQTGFRDAVSPELTLFVNQTATQDFHLQVGTASQTVSVGASTPLLQASTTELGSVVSERAVGDLPLNGRNFTALLTLTPGVSAINYSQFRTTSYAHDGGGPGLPTSSFVSPSVQGQWNRENIYFLDGVINTNSYSGTYDVLPVIDGTQEFKIQSHNDGAEFGGVLGGVVNIVTKSGSNQFHGALWEYLRNNAFDSRNPFTDFNGNVPAPPAPFRQNEFGGDIGGPVWIPKLYNGHNKTFFFFSYEGWRYSKAAGLSYIAPTSAELSGDFTDASVRVNGQPPLMYNPFETTGTPGNYTRPLLGGDGLHVPASMINAGNQAFLTNYGDKPNFVPAVPGDPNTIMNLVGTNNANELDIRVDQNFGASNSVWFRYSSTDGAANAPQSFHITDITSSNNRNWGGGYTHVFSPTLILDATAGHSGRFDGRNAGMPVDVTPVPAFAGQIGVYGYLNFTMGNVASGLGGHSAGYYSISGAGPETFATYENNYAVNLTWMHGNHQVRFGFQQIIPQYTQGLQGAQSDNNYIFNSAETADPHNQGSTGNPLASALLGLPDSGEFRNEVMDFRVLSSGAYIQDSWKATPRLTLIAGLRWDGESSPHLLRRTTAAMLDPNTGNWIISGGKLPPACNAAGGVYAPCIPSSTPENDAVLASHFTVAANPNLGPDPVNDDFGPRIGVAYKLDSSTVIRAGYSLLYDNIQGVIQTLRDRVQAWPYNSNLTPVFNVIGQPLQTMTEIIPTLSSGDALPAVPTPWQQLGWYYDPKMKNQYSHEFNIEIQRQMTSSLAASIAYAGSIDRRLPLTGIDNNSPNPGGAGMNRQFPWAESAIMATDRGTSNYNALEVKVEKRMASGLAFGAGYTWSKAMDNGASGYYGSEEGPAAQSNAQNYYDLSANYGISAFSIPSVVYAWGVYSLPFGRGQLYLKHGFGSEIFGGWQTNIILSAQSGPPPNLSGRWSRSVKHWQHERPKLRQSQSYWKSES